MKKTTTFLIVLILGLIIFFACNKNHPDQGNGISSVVWSHLPDVPDTLGRAGAFVGKQREAIIFAGGANFPDKPSWQGGKKVYYGDIYVLEHTKDGYQWYTNKKLKLPNPLGYGVTVSTSKGVILIGGTDGKKIYQKVFRLRWDPANRTVHIEPLPDLPKPLAFMAGAKLNNKIFVAGGRSSPGSNGITKAFCVLNLDSLQNGWTKLPSWPGPRRVLAVADVQNFGDHEDFYLFSGRNFKSDGAARLLTDAYRYDPEQQKWTALDPVEIDGETRCVMGAPSVAYGKSHILVFGGDPGRELKRRVEIVNKIKELKAEYSQNNQNAARTKEYIQQLKNTLDSLTIHASPYSSDILAYDTKTDTWSVAGTIPSPSPVTTGVVKWKQSVVIPSGEIFPGIRTPHVLRGKFH